MIALVLPTGATGDLVAAIAEADVGVPLAVVVLNQPEAVRLLDAKSGKVPAYAYPEAAARALSRAVKYARVAGGAAPDRARASPTWTRSGPGRIVHGVWLRPATCRAAAAVRLPRCTRADEDDAAAAPAGTRWLKASPGLAQDRRGVLLDLAPRRRAAATAAAAVRRRLTGSVSR